MSTCGIFLKMEVWELACFRAVCVIFFHFFFGEDNEGSDSWGTGLSIRKKRKKSKTRHYHGLTTLWELNLYSFHWLTLIVNINVQQMFSVDGQSLHSQSALLCRVNLRGIKRSLLISGNTLYQTTSLLLTLTVTVWVSGRYPRAYNISVLDIMVLSSASSFPFTFPAFLSLPYKFVQKKPKQKRCQKKAKKKKKNPLKEKAMVLSDWSLWMQEKLWG